MHKQVSKHSISKIWLYKTEISVKNKVNRELFIGGYLAS